MKHLTLEFFRWTVIVICYLILAWFVFYAVQGFVDNFSSPNQYSADNLW